jgi:hypothetical protein
VTAVAAGSSHSLALKSNGTVVAWGRTSGETAVPAGLTGVTAIAAGSFHSLALKSNGAVVAWGGSREGETDVPAGLTDVTAIAAGEEHSVAVGKLRRPDLLISRVATGPYLGNDLYNTAGVEGQTLTSTARRGRVRDFYVRVRNDGNTVGAFTVRGSASMRGSVVRYYSAGVEITTAMRSAGGWRPVVAPGAMRQLRAQVRIGSRATIGSLKSAKVTATWQGHEPDAVKGVVRVVR